MNTHQAGIVVGIGAGFYKAVTTVKLTILSLVSLNVIFDTLILAMVGGIAGALGSEIVKFVKKIYLKRKNDKKTE